MTESNPTQVILTDDGLKIIKAQNTADKAVGGVTNLNDPNLMSVIEKHTQAAQYAGLTSQYNVILVRAKDAGINTTDLTTAYTNLNAFMTAILTDTTKASDVDRKTYKNLIDTYNIALSNVQTALSNNFNADISNMQSSVSTASQAASSAAIVASQAATTGNNASQTASSAASAASKAQITASSAVSVANSASQAASGAVLAGSQAAVKGDAALSAANQAQSAAANATNVANSATNVANSAKSAADSTYAYATSEITIQSNATAKAQSAADNAFSKAQAVGSQASAEIVAQSNATAKAQSAADSAFSQAVTAINNDKATSQAVTDLKDGSTMTIAQLQNGLATKVTNSDYASYKEQTASQIGQMVTNSVFSAYQQTTAGLIAQKVATKDFSTYKDQTATAINSKVDNSDFSTYQTQTANLISQTVTNAVNNINVGGRNYILNSDFYITSGQKNVLSSVEPNEYSGKKITVSVDIEINNLKTIADSGFTRVGYEASFHASDNSTAYVGVWKNLAKSDIGKSFKYRAISNTYDLTQKTITSINDGNGALGGVYIQGVTADSIKVGHPKLEIATEATDWSPAPEDLATQSQITQLSGEIEQKVDSGDFSTYKTQTANLIGSKVDNSDYQSYKTQTANMIGSKVNNSDFSTYKTQTAQLIGSKVDNGDYQSYKTQTADLISQTVTNAVNNINVGGRNIVLDSSNMGNFRIWQADGNSKLSDDKTEITVTTSHGGVNIEKKNLSGYLPNKGDTVVISADVKGTSHIQFNYNDGNSFVGGGTNIAVTTEYKRYFTTFEWNPVNSDRTQFVIFAVGSAGQYLTIKNVKVEIGNKPTDWSPAPEDQATQSQFTQLSNDMNLRVKKGELIDQINLQAGKTLISSSGQLTLSGKSVLLDSVDPVIMKSANIGNMAVGTAQIANGAITNAQIGNLAVGTANIKDAAINSAKIANLAVGTAQIGDGAITNAKIANLAVGTAQIANAAITDAQVGNVSANKLTAGTIDFNTITGKNINASNITTGKMSADRLDVSKLSAVSADLGDVTTGSLKGVDIVAKTFSTPNGSFTTDANGAVVASSLTIRGVTNLVYNAALLGGSGSNIPGWNISNNGTFWPGNMHDGVPSIGFNASIGAGVWSNFAQTKLHLLNGNVYQPFSASVWFKEYGSDTSLSYQFTLAFFDSNGNRINGGFRGNTWNGIGSEQDWRYVTINNVTPPSNAVSVGLQYWAYNGHGNGCFSSPMLTQTAQATGYQPDTGNVISAGEIDGSVINGSTINGTTINTPNLNLGFNGTFTEDFDYTQDAGKFLPKKNKGTLTFNHGVLQSAGNMQTYVNGQWGGMNDNLEFQSGIANAQWTELAPGYIKLDLCKQDGSIGQRAYADPTGFYYTSAKGDKSYLGNILQTGQVQTPSLIGKYIGPSKEQNLLQIGSNGNDYGLQVGSYAGAEAVLSDFIYNFTSSASANVRITDHGHLARSTSASKYKYNIKNPDIETTLGDRLLNVHMATWNDKHAVDTYAEQLTTGETREKLSIKEYYGLIAEQLRDAGLDMFIDYGKNHEIEGIQYDRAWIPLLSVIRRLNDKVNEYELRLSKLEGTNK